MMGSTCGGVWGRPDFIISFRVEGTGRRGNFFGFLEERGNFRNAAICKVLMDGKFMSRALLLRTSVAASEPLHDIKIRRSVEGNGVARKQFGHHDEITIGGKLVGDELGVDELVADDIGDDQDSLFRRLVFRIGKVGLN